MRKKLIVSGDSCTEDDFHSPCHPDWDFEYPKWPNFVADYLDMDLVNLASGGRGNYFVYSTLQDKILNTPKSQIGLVIAGWTQSHRDDWGVGLSMGRKDERGRSRRAYNQPWRSERVNKNGDLLFWVTRTLRLYIDFQCMCSRFNIPFCHFQMGDIFETYLDGLRPTEVDRLLGMNDKDDRMRYPGKRERDQSLILDSIASYDPFIENFMGWPPLQFQYSTNHSLDTYQSLYYWGKQERPVKWTLSDRGGWNMHEKVLGRTQNEMRKRGLIVSDLDDHPNEEGHKVIADTVIAQIQKMKNEGTLPLTLGQE
tara:strand:+ start:48 stop:980 length:933 start_codon:yes stop_codon:yes gene_type:complete